MGNPIQQAQQSAYLAAITANTSPAQRAALAAAAIASQRKVMSLPYYSTVRFQLPAIASTTYTLVPPVPDRQAFGYKIGDPLGAAQGFDAANTYGQATEAETNMLVASQTRGNDDVWIYGIAAMWTPESDAQIVQLATRNCSLNVALGGENRYVIGRLDFVPSGGGLYGVGTSYLTPPDLASTWNTRWSQLDNGTPGRDNYFRLPQPLIWRGNGNNSPDTSLTMTVRQARNIVINSAADRAAAAGVAGWTKPVPPNTVGTYADLTLRAICQSVGKRSENS